MKSEDREDADSDDAEELFAASEPESNAAEDESPPDPTSEKASSAARKLEPVVLAHVLGPKYQPVKPRVIAKQLGLPSEQHRALKLAIRRLVKGGKLAYGSGHQVRAPGRQESGVRSQGSGGRSQGSGVRDQGAGDTI